MIVSAIQINAGTDIDANLAKVEVLINKAAGQGAVFVSLPEYFACYGPVDEWFAAVNLHREILTRMAAMARKNRIYLLAGSVLAPSKMGGKARNTSILFGPGGEIAGRYAKIHLFDARTEAGSYMESRWLDPGHRLAVAPVRGWKTGLAICFDLRFPGHFTSLMRKGAELIAVPSAFTHETGKDHWETLVRTRAMDTQCYIAAPALSGKSGPRRCYGHSMIVDPWGRVIASMKEGEGVVTAELDRRILEKVRKAIPLRIPKE